MEPYDDMSTVEMTRAELKALEDRSNFLGPDQAPGHRFRCNLNYIAGTPRWVVGTFYVDEEAKAETLKGRETYREDPWHPTIPAEDLYPDNFVKARWERVVFTDGPAPEHTTSELQGLVRRHHETKAKLGL